MPLRYVTESSAVTPRVNATACAALFYRDPCLEPQLLDWLLLEDSMTKRFESREKR